MKRSILFIFSLLAYANLLAQGESGVLKEYNRSSLATLMVYHPEDEFCKDIAIVFDTMPTPDKYNDQNIYGLRFIDFNAFRGLKRKNETYAFRSQAAYEMQLNEAVYQQLKSSNSIINQVGKVGKFKESSIGLHKAKYGKTLTAKQVEANGQAIAQMLNENQYAKYLIAKWFNLQGNDLNDMTFNMDLVFERGNYNATEMDVELAQRSARGLALLADAGDELIGNTYVIVNDITYVTTEEKAQVGKAIGGTIMAILGALAGQSSAEINRSVQSVADIADSFTGFDVKTHSYLFRLVWNEDVEGTFYSQHYTATPDPAKLTAFLADDTTYRVEYVAHEYEFYNKSTLKGIDRNAYVRYVCTRSMDKNIAALQLKYEDFKVKTPVYNVVKEGAKTLYVAKIGMKEGITENSSFQVVRREIDPQTNRTTYRYVATVKPVKGRVWDNRYMMAEERQGQTLNATYFQKVAGGEILPGMLLIEGKYRKVKTEE